MRCLTFESIKPGQLFFFFRFRKHNFSRKTNITPGGSGSVKEEVGWEIVYKVRSQHISDILAGDKPRHQAQSNSKSRAYGHSHAAGALLIQQNFPGSLVAQMDGKLCLQRRSITRSISDNKLYQK